MGGHSLCLPHLWCCTFRFLKRRGSPSSESSATTSGTLALNLIFKLAPLSPGSAGALPTCK